MFTARLITENYPPPLAMAELTRMQARLPGRYYIDFYLGMSCLAVEDTESALAHFSRSLDQGPTRQDVPSIYSYMGVCLKDLGQYPEALDVLAKGGGSRSGTHRPAQPHGLLPLQAQGPRGGHRLLSKSARTGSEFGPSTMPISPRTTATWGDTPKAIQYYEMALELDPSIEFARESPGSVEGGRLKAEGITT